MLIRILIFFSASAVLAVAAVLFARLLGIKSLKLGKRHLCLEKMPDLRGECFSRRDGATALLWAFFVLCLLYGVSILYCGIFMEEVSWQSFCSAWQRYDAAHYLGLAEKGYSGYTENGTPYFLVFFPLYPWLMRLLHQLIPNYALCGHLLSCLCYLGGSYVLYRLMVEEFGHKTARQCLLFFSAYPFAFFFASIHTESLFLLLSLLSFYFIRRHRYPLAGLFGALAALTRMQGLTLALVAFAEYCSTEHPLKKLRARAWKSLWRDLWGKLFWMAFTGLGTLIYLLLNASVTGDTFAFTAFQSQRWNQGFQLFTKSLAGLWQVLWHPAAGYSFVGFTTWGPELALFFICLGALLHAARRLEPVWLLYLFICVLLNISLRNPLSFGRYMACAFPLPLVFAMLGEKRPVLGRFLTLSGGVLQGLFLLSYLAGRHVC